jgi:hypothetical protein
MKRLGRPRAAAVLTLALLAGLAVPAAMASQGDDAPALAVNGAAARASWNEGWLRPGAAVLIKGSVGAPSSLTAVLRPVARAGIVTARADFEVPRTGAFSERLSLPPRPLPGAYELRVSGSSGSRPLEPVELAVTIPAPPEGVLDRALVGTTKNGPWLRYANARPPVVHGSHKELWTRFTFLYPPTGRRVELIWKLRWHKVIGRVYRRYKNTIDTYARSTAPLPQGLWNVVLRIDGRIAKQMDVRLLG